LNRPKTFDVQHDPLPICRLKSPLFNIPIPTFSLKALKSILEDKESPSPSFCDRTPHFLSLSANILVPVFLANTVVKIHLAHREILLKWIPSLSDECLYETEG